jgi:galactosamine-6-phosphate isomerase
MKIFVTDSYQNMSKKAVDEVIHITTALEKPLISPASGDSTAGLYNEIAERARRNEMNISNWHFVGLDEWVGMNGNDEGSCRYHLNLQLFRPLHITEDRICFFDGRASEQEKECERVDDYILQHGGIDVAIVGLGMNGHVGMNEPGTPRNTHAHVAEIAEATQMVGQKYFKSQQNLDYGLTLGIATLMEARHIILLVSGKHKAAITQKIIEEEVSEQLPASLLRNHPSFKIFMDEDAAEKMLQR